jgi:hypothetical protein
MLVTVTRLDATALLVEVALVRLLPPPTLLLLAGRLAAAVVVLVCLIACDTAAVQIPSCCLASSWWSPDVELSDGELVHNDPIQDICRWALIVWNACVRLLFAFRLKMLKMKMSRNKVKGKDL